jgi:hypothetical protein
VKQSYEKTWQFDMNRAYGDVSSTLANTAKYVLWYYKAFLTGQIGGATQGLWTVAGSSDGVTGGMDGVDRWGAAYDATKVVNTTTPRSWVVLQSPPMNKRTYYLLFDCGTGAANSNTVNITLGVDAAPTGGTINAAPTVQNAVPMTTNRYFHHNTNPGPIHLHGALATDGSFNVLLSRDNTGMFSSGLVLQWIGNAKPTDQYPVWLHMSCNQTLSVGYGNGTAQDLTQTTYCVMRAPDNSQGGNWAGIIPVSTNFPSVVDVFDGTTLDWDVWVGATTAGYQSVRGRIQDISYFPGGANTGSIDGTVGAPSFMIVGNYWFPTNTAPIL